MCSLIMVSPSFRDSVGNKHNVALVALGCLATIAHKQVGRKPFQTFGYNVSGIFFFYLFQFYQHCTIDLLPICLT